MKFYEHEHIFYEYMLYIYAYLYVHIYLLPFMPSSVRIYICKYEINT